MKNSLYIIIVGCGRLGSYLANNLSGAGLSVVVIDKDDSVFNNLSQDFSGFRISADATHLQILKQAKIDKADAFIATTREDNVNLMVAQVARKIYAVPTVLARVFDPKREEVYTKLGIGTICPTSVAAELFLGIIRGTENLDEVRKQ